MDSYLRELYDKPCECITCTDCRGFGQIDDPMDYSGRYPETCWGCDGHGVVEVCDRCHEIAEVEGDLEFA